jgi:outer membrane protein OmpA-like peptidoglycan-associated protein
LGRTAKGEAYIEAGAGLIVPHNNDVDSNGKNAHVIGALGYRFFCPSSQSRFFDLSAVYDGYSPRKEPLSTLGVRVGLGWIFGSNRQAANAGKPAVQATPEPPKVSTKEAVKAVSPATSKAVSVANAKLDKQAEEIGKVADVKRSAEGIEVNMKSDILFAPGKAELKPEAVEQINKVGDILAKYPNEKIEITGYADSKGSDAVNKTVSEKRANAVKDALLARKVSAGSLTAVGKGSADPIGDNKTAEGRAKNRRVELKITSQK